MPVYLLLLFFFCWFHPGIIVFNIPSNIIPFNVTESKTYYLMHIRGRTTGIVDMCKIYRGYNDIFQSNIICLYFDPCFYSLIIFNDCLLQSLPFTNSYSQVRADFIKLLMHNYGIMLPTACHVASVAINRLSHTVTTIHDFYRTFTA